MDEKYIFSIIGIFLGWVLKELSTLGTRRLEKKQKLGHAIACLMSLHREIVLLKANLEVWKLQSESAESFERMRQYITTRIHHRESNLANSLDDALKTVSLYYPLEAEDLDHTVTGLDFHSTIKLDKTSAVKDMYLAQLSILEIGVDLSIGKLTNSIKKLGFKHGILTWFSLRKELKRIENDNLIKKASPLLDPLFEELNKMKETQQKAQD